MGAGFVIPTIFSAIDKASSVARSMASKINSATDAVGKKYQDISDIAKKTIVGGAVVGTSIIAPMGLATKKAIDFEDAMANVAKTTELQGASLEQLGKSILHYKTSTSNADLANIATIGGSLGVAKDQLEAFIPAADKFNIALGDDFGGVDNAVRSVASLKNLFKETRGLTAADEINKVGSAINALTTKGANAQSMNDFTQRLGALPDFLEPSIQDTIALSAVLDKAGISAEVAASGMTQLASLGGREVASFAKQMKLSTVEAQKLLNTDPSKFAFKVAESFKGMEATDAIRTMDGMKIKSNEVMKIIGALGSNYDQFTEFQAISNKEFAIGNSLAAEAAVKNSTHGSRLKALQKDLEGVAIKTGELLLPILDKLISKVGPIIDSLSKWITENKDTASTIAMVAGGIGAFAFVLSGLAGIIEAIITIKKAWAVAQVALNIAMEANPIGLMIIAGLALVAVVASIIKYWDSWGKYVVLLMGPLGMIINLIMTIAKHWEAIKSAFKEGGILEGFKAIGRCILDFLLSPIKRVLELVGKIPGVAKLVKPALEMMNSWTEPVTQSQIKGRDDFEHIMNNMEAKPVSAIDLRAERDRVNSARMESTINNRLGITIKDQSGMARVTENPGGIPVRLKPNIGAA